MALRHTFVSGDVPLRLQPALVPLPHVLPPTGLEFRRGADMQKFVRDLTRFPVSRVEAATGSGKSVRLPKVIALEKRLRVYHVVPSQLLALDLFAHVEATLAEGVDASGVKLAYYNGTGDISGDAGLVICGAPAMVAHLFRLKQQKGETFDMRDSILYLDEAHESDAFTHFLRTTAGACGYECFISASATFKPSDFRKSETPGAVNQLTYDASEDPATWCVGERGKPWSLENLTGNVAVFSDSKRVVKHLAGELEEAGLFVCQLESTSTEEELRRVRSVLADPRSGVVALILDSSFRSGFTFPITKIIDTGRVSYYDPTPGEFQKFSRAIFHAESVQTAGRLGRLGPKGEYYRPAGDLERSICKLEGVEAEAAVYLYRCFGYKPPVDLRSRVMAEDVLPEDVSVVNALRGCYPLTYYTRKSNGSLRPRSPPPVKLEDQVDAARGVRVDEKDSSKLSIGRVQELEPGTLDSGSFDGLGSPVEDSEDLWDRMVFTESAGTPEVLDIREYYYCAALDLLGSQVTSRSFPHGTRSVLSAVTARDFKHDVSYWSSADRSFALAKCLDRYNALTAEGKGLKAALYQAVTSENAGLLDLPEVRHRMENYVDNAATWERECNTLLHAIAALADGKYAIKKLSRAPKVESSRVKAYLPVFQGILRELNVVTEDQYLESLENRKIKFVSDFDSDSRHGTRQVRFLKSPETRLLEPGERGVRTVRPREVEVNGRRHQEKYVDRFEPHADEVGRFGRMLTGVRYVTRHRRGVHVTIENG